MLFHDAIIILAMTFPMFIFTIFIGIKLANYSEEKYNISEFNKRAVMLGGTFMFALVLSTLLYYI
jgi:hypothetical protein